jgi:hypothetical protein
MRNARLCLILAAVTCPALPTTGLAAEPAQGRYYSGMPAVQAPVADVAPAPSSGALQAAAPTQAPVVYLVQPTQATQPPGAILGLPFEQLVTVLATLLIPLLLGIAGLIWKDKAKERRDTVAQWIRAAYLITEEVARLTPNVVDDKIAYALRVLNERLQAAGITPTAAIGDQARATWTAMSGAEKVESNVRAKAALAVAARPQTPLAGT